MLSEAKSELVSVHDDVGERVITENWAGVAGSEWLVVEDGR